MNWSQLSEQAPVLLAQYGVNLLAALLIFFIGKWLAKRAVFWASQEAQQRGLDVTVCRFLANIAYIAVLVLLALAAISRLGVPTTSFLAIIGAAGLAIGLALQGSLSNFASGVLLVFLKPCKVGDWVESGSVSGAVNKIQLFNTVLSTGDKRTIIIPNTKLFNETMINYSTSETRRVDMVIGISYDADIPTAKALLRSLVEADDRVLKEPSVQIGVLALAESSVQIAVRPWVNSADYWPLKFDLNEHIKIALDEAGIEIPYPQMKVDISR